MPANGFRTGNAGIAGDPAGFDPVALAVGGGAVTLMSVPVIRAFRRRTGN